jgi:hypothetical protein
MLIPFFRLQLIGSGANEKPEINTDQSQRKDVDTSATSDKPTQAGESQTKAEAQTCMYFLHNCGLIDLMKS